MTALFTPKGRSSYNPGMPNPLTGEPPKSAFPPSSSEARRMRRQGVDFHSIPEFAKKYNLSGPDFQPDYTFETGSSIISPSTHGQVQCESISESEGHTEDTQDTQTESEFDAEADYSWEAEDSEDSPDPLDLDGLSELGLVDPGGDGNFHSDENSFHDFFYSRQETVEDDIFSQSIVVKDIESLLLTSSSASSTLTPPPPQRSHSHRPVLSPLTLPSIIEPCLPTSSPMDPYMEQHLLDRSSVPAPRDLLITIDPGSTEISNSKSQEHPDGEPPRSAFDSDSDLSCNEDADSRRHSRRSPSKPPGKLRRLKDALKGSISMPSMRAAKAKHAQASGEGTPSRSSSRFSHLPPLPNSPKVSSHGHTASMVSTISGISMTSRTSSTPTTSPSTATSCSSLGRSQAHLSPLEHLFQRDDSRRPHRRGSRTSSIASFSPHTPNSPSLEVDHVDQVSPMSLCSEASCLDGTTSQRRLTNNLTPSSYPRPRTRPRTSASSHSTNSSYTLNHNSHIDITKAEDVWRTENLKRRTTSPLNPSKSLSNLSTPTTPPNIPLPPLPPLPPVGTAHLQSFEHLSHSALMTPASGSVKELPSDTSSPVAVTVTDTNNTTHADANANVDVGMENRKVLLAESLARLQAHKPQAEAYTWGSTRPALPPKIQWIATGSDLKAEDKPKLPAKRPSVVVSPTTLQRLDFSSLNVSPASCYSSDDQPSQDASSASLLLDVTEMAGRDASRTEGVNRIPLLPEFDFERPKYPASLKDGSCGQHKKPVLTHHIRKTSSLSDLPRLLHLHNTKGITMRSTHNLTHPPRFANLSTSSAESSALQTPSDSTSPAISRASSTTSSYSLKPIQSEPVQPMGDAKAVIPFLYRQLNNGFLSSTTLRPLRSASEVSLPTDEQHVIPTSIQRESPKGRGEKKSKVSKLLERVGSSKSVRGSLSIRN